MDNETLVIFADDTTAYSYDVGSSWLTMNDCTSKGATLHFNDESSSENPEDSEESEDPTDSNSEGNGEEKNSSILGLSIALILALSTILF